MVLLGCLSGGLVVASFEHLPESELFVLGPAEGQRRLPSSLVPVAVFVEEAKSSEAAAEGSAVAAGVQAAVIGILFVPGLAGQGW